MKKYRKKLLILIVLIVCLIAGIVFLTPKHKQKVYEPKIEENKSKFLTMMVEKTDGSGIYEENSDSSWPGEGYAFNSKLSGCENGSKIKWIEETHQIQASATSSDRCYIYFDKDSIASLCRGQNLSECFTQNYKKDGTIIYHDGQKDYDTEQNVQLEAGDNNYRYAGASADVHNYVCFGTNDKETCLREKDKYLYRIIGFFNNGSKYEAKLIKADYANGDLLGKGANKPSDAINYDTDGSYYTYTTYGPKLNSKNNHEEQDAFSHRYRGSLNAVDRYRWQENGTQQTVANWPEALLNKIHLNHNFINKYESGWQNKITNHAWKYKGNTWQEIAVGSKNSTKTIKTVYDHELGTSSDQTTYSAKIGLFYVSDYLYAASSNNWTKWPYNGTYIYRENGTDAESVPTGTYDGTDGTDYRSAIDENWMYLGLWEWTITQRTDASGVGAFYVHAPGDVSSHCVGAGALVVRPSFYLTSSEMLKGGAGIASDPYLIS